MTSVERDFKPDRTRPSADDSAIWRRFRGALGDDIRVSALQRVKLSAKAPSGFGMHLRNLAPADPLRGEALMQDRWRIGMERIILRPGEAPWMAVLPSKHFADRLHRFDWLPDLFAQGYAGADRARYCVDAWIDLHGKFNGFSWRIGVTAARLWAWMRCGSELFDEGSDHVRTQRMETLNRQLRHLEHSLHTSPDPAARWTGACVLVARSLCLDGGQELAEQADRLEAECFAQIMPDGGHVSRSPSVLLSCLLDLLTLKELYERAGRMLPDLFDKWLPRMGAMVQFFQREDGGLAPFNNGDEALPERVEAALGLIGTPLRRFTVAPKSGFQKLEKNGLSLLLDCGGAPDTPFGDFAHAGALGFELSDGPCRLVTSCGYSAEVNVDWQAAVRRTSAHSTLIMAGRDSARFSANDQSRLLAPHGPEGISAKRLEEGDEIWLDAQHSGYKSPYGLLHRRRLFMAGDGSRLTGEDSLVRPISQGQAEAKKFVQYDIRFHLHPTVTAMKSKSGIRLICPNGQVWQFKASHENMQLEKTIYLARGKVEQPDQIVMTGMADPNGDGLQPPNAVRWAFMRETAL